MPIDAWCVFEGDAGHSCIGDSALLAVSEMTGVDVVVVPVCWSVFTEDTVGCL